MTAKIVLDTNFLLIPVEFKVDIFAEIERICSFPYELCIVEKTLGELEHIANTRKGKTAMAAKIGKELVNAKKITILPMERFNDVDRELLHLGKKGDIIATQDKDLKRMLKFHGVQRITLRKKSFLLLEGETCITKKR